MRILGIDFGDARIGVAVSDELGMFASTVAVIAEKGEEAQLSRLSEYIKMYKPEKIVLGNPINMDGSSGARAQKSAEFKQKLEEAFALPVILWDERLSSVSAHRILEERGVSGKKRKGKVDPIAAALILQGYLDSV